MQAHDHLALDATTRSITRDGFLKVRAKAARTGHYQYTGREVDPDNKQGLRDQAIVNILRDEQTVFDKASVASFVGKPITNDHPTVAVYYPSLQNFISIFRSRVTGAANAPFVIGSMVPNVWQGKTDPYASINAAHVQASVDIAGVKYSLGADAPLPNNDGLHYQPEAAVRTQGRRLGLALSDAVGPTVTNSATIPATVNTKLAVTLTGSDVHQTFHIRGGANAAQFEISDPYTTPRLRWTGDGNGPAIGSYAVAVAARDGAGNYGPDKTFTVNVQAAGMTSPVAFFDTQTPERGYVFDFSDTSSLSQNADGTGAVTAGSPVGRILDKSPDANHFTATGSQRPTYQVDGDGKPYLQFSGAQTIIGTKLVADDNKMVFTAMHGVQAASQSGSTDLLAQAAPDATTFSLMLSASTAAARIFMRFTGGSNYSGASVPSFHNNAKKVWSAQYAGSNQFSRVRDAANRPAWTQATVGTVADVTDDTRVALGSRPSTTPSSFFVGRVYSGFAINRVLIDAELTQGGDWVAARTGVVLP
jgi:hypothetical protein